MITKIDHKKEFKPFYAPPKKPTILDVPPFNYLMVNGAGPPGVVQRYTDALEALYSLSYAIRFAIKDREQIAYTVMPLEGLWWAEDMNAFIEDNRDQWLWTMMIHQPNLVTPSLIEEMREITRKKKNPIALADLRMESYEAGKVVQMLHIGPYAEEAPNIQWMHTYAKEQGYALRGKHQEIYLSDPRRTAPEKLKTVIRQPIQ